MPQRYIKVPQPVQLMDPFDSTPMLDKNQQPEKPLDFKGLLQKLMHNPIWTETYPNICSAHAINMAFAKAAPGSVVTLAEEDWKKLEQTVQSPRQVIAGPAGVQIVPGLGYHPVVITQLLPLLEPIVNASTTSPVDEK